MDREWRNGQRRSDKLRRSLASRIPKSWPQEMTTLFLNRLADSVNAAFNDAPPKVGIFLVTMIGTPVLRTLKDWVCQATPGILSTPGEMSTCQSSQLGSRSPVVRPNSLCARRWGFETQRLRECFSDFSGSNRYSPQAR